MADSNTGPRGGGVVLHGLPPRGADSPAILVLGSFPSASSLAEGSYYAHPRNHFWALLSAIAGQRLPAAEAEKDALLAALGIVLWDLVASCERRGSLDAAIREAVLNPVADYLQGSPRITRIALNGSAAARLFLRGVATGARPAPGGGGGGLPALGSVLRWTSPLLPGRLIEAARLPSSSPVPTAAFRRMEDKLPLWRAFLGPAAGEAAPGD